MKTASSLLQKIVAVFLFAAFISMPVTSQAGILDFASRMVKWWHAGSIGAKASDASTVKSMGSDEGESPSESKAPDDGGSIGNGTATPGKCQVPQSPPVTQCDVGSGFLCVNTPPGGVSDSSFVLKGTIDRKTSVLTSIKIVAQNEYTKGITEVDTTDAAESGCSDGVQLGKPFCLDSEGRFAATVELPEKGPYTVSVSATQLTGAPSERLVRISRVVPTELSADDVSFDPDVRSLPSVDVSHVMVAVDLLGDCQFCDFIGASTGGVQVTVENVIVNESGEQKTISCATTVEQGGQGRFAVGIPVGSGKNTLTIRACNAAAMGSACPEISGITFSASATVDVSDSIEFLSPEPLPSYDSEQYPVIQWKFKLGGSDACIEVRFNRETPINICPDSQGVYSINLNPREGINVASLAHESGADEFAWTFGWGKILSPYASADGGMEIPSSVELGIPASTLGNIILPLVNNFLASDERSVLLKQILDGTEEGGGQPSDDSDILALIPQCSSQPTEKFSTVLRGEPKIGQATLMGLSFEQDDMDLSVMLKDVEVGLDLIPQNDLPPLPLVIAFRAAKLDLALINGKCSEGKPLILLSSHHEDCEYKSGTYCKHKPAPLVPANLVGGANAYGGFIRCETGLATGKAVEACNAINSLNAQTGVLSETVLDALNDVLYCSGSKALTVLARRGISLPPITFGCETGLVATKTSEGEECTGAESIVPNVRIPLAVSLNNGINLSKAGILMDVGVRIGDIDTYAQTPAEYQIDSAGIIIGKGFGESSFDKPDTGGDVNLALGLDAVNALLFAAIAQGDGRVDRGLLDIDVHEPFFKKLGFDFVKECDEFEVPAGEEKAPPTLCNIRPRVSELLGSALTTYGYFPGNQPVLLAVRGNRALGARISVTGIEDIPVVQQQEGGTADNAYTPVGSLLSVDVGGMILSFYALEVDENVKADAYGNLAIKLDAYGNPVIHSMRPDDSDPWNGPIISFDLSLLLGIEIGTIDPDPEDDSNFKMKLKVLGDRSRLVLTPIPGSNATTVPASGLVSALAEKLKLALAEFEDFDIPIPKELAFSADDDGMFGMLGLAKITFKSENGLKLELENERNTAVLALSAAITQILHQGGVEKKYELKI